MLEEHSIYCDLLSRFPFVASMIATEDGRHILLADILYDSFTRGWLRSIDVTTRDYAVTTLSATGLVCANDTFINPASVDILRGTPYVMIVDSLCNSVHTYNMDTGEFLLTAGRFYISDVYDGQCLEAGRIGYASAGVWNTDGDMFVVVATPSKQLLRITAPNTPQCMVSILVTGLWPESTSLWGGMLIESNNVLLVVAGMELRRVSLTPSGDAISTDTKLVGQYQSDPGLRFWSAGISCAARMGVPSMILRHGAETHGGDSAVYIADRGSFGGTPSIWRVSMPCPTNWYWSDDGVCARTVPRKRCEPCPEERRTCMSAALTQEECTIQGNCQVRVRVCRHQPDRSMHAVTRHAGLLRLVRVHANEAGHGCPMQQWAIGGQLQVH